MLLIDIFLSELTLDEIFRFCSNLDCELGDGTIFNSVISSCKNVSISLLISTSNSLSIIKLIYR